MKDARCCTETKKGLQSLNVCQKEFAQNKPFFFLVSCCDDCHEKTKLLSKSFLKQYGNFRETSLKHPSNFFLYPCNTLKAPLKLPKRSLQSSLKNI